MRGGDWACSVSDQVSQESGDRTAHNFEPDFSGPSVVDRDLIDLLGRFVELWTRSEYRRTAIRRKLPVRKCEVFLRRTKEEQKDGWRNWRWTCLFLPVPIFICKNVVRVVRLKGKFDPMILYGLGDSMRSWLYLFYLDGFWVPSMGPV